MDVGTHARAGARYPEAARQGSRPEISRTETNGWNRLQLWSIQILGRQTSSTSVILVLSADALRWHASYFRSLDLSSFDLRQISAESTRLNFSIED